MFEIVVAVTVQSVFRLEMHQNEVFFFILNHFLHHTSKQSENIKKKIHFKQKKNVHVTIFAELIWHDFY